MNRQLRLLLLLDVLGLLVLTRPQSVGLTTAGAALATVLAGGGVAGLLYIVVGDEELAVLAVAVGLFAGDIDDIEGTLESGGGFGKDGVHLFEGAVGGLGEEEVGDGDNDSVDDGEDGVGVVLDGVEGDGSNHNDLEV